MFAIALSCLLLGGSLFAQESRIRQCPDQVIRRVETKVTPVLPQTCGSNLNATIAGIQVTTRVNECPLVVVVRPGHDATASSPGSGTYTVPVKTVPVTILQFECQESWLLGILPIVISSRCTEARSRVAGTVTHYEQRACDGEGTPPLELDREPARRISSTIKRRQRS